MDLDSDAPIGDAAQLREDSVCNQEIAGSSLLPGESHCIRGRSDRADRFLGSRSVYDGQAAFRPSRPRRRFQPHYAKDLESSRAKT